MSTLIETTHASIDTLAVTIRALHVGGKQMTLAVFRQLPVADAYEDDGSPAPLEPWGTVRYDIKDQCDLWLVASKDGLLFRCPLPYVRPTDDVSYHESQLRKYLKWEAETIAYKSGERLVYPYSGDIDASNLEVGQRYRFDRWLAHAQLEARYSTTKAATRDKYLRLPQLFIAV